MTSGLAGQPAKAAGRPVLPAGTGPQHFWSRPDLKFPPVTVHQFGKVAKSRYIFLDVPYTAAGHGGTAIINARGELVWFGPNTPLHHRLNFNVQELNGEQVLTWWQGQVVQGHGRGELVIADSSYQVKQVIKAFNGAVADLHEFVITPQGTALISAYRTHSAADLTKLGGPKSGYIFSGVFQEIDIATGTLLFEWDSYDPATPPVAVTETHLPFPAGKGTKADPFDYFHINSIDKDTAGDYVVSGRHTWTIYKISKADGAILWRMNGKKSDFTMGPGASYAWQHHVRPHGHGQLTVFDNGAADIVTATEKQSRALILAFDEAARKVTLVRAYTHPGARVLAKALGSAQILPGGEMFVNWGTERRFSQFSADGQLLLDGKMVLGASSYRGFSKEWTGHPAELPAVAARPRSGGGSIVYASWNGATGVASWTAFAGRTATSLARAGAIARSGFETAIPVTSAGPYFAVQAHDAAGRALARSKPVRLA